MTNSSQRGASSDNWPESVASWLCKPYARVIQREGPELFTASVLEFPGVAAEGRTADEAFCGVNEVLGMVLEVMLEDGDEIPEPFASIPYSGRLNLRIPPRLHADAARAAAIENISLNRFLSDAVARRVGSVAHRQESGRPAASVRQSRDSAAE